MAAKVCAVVCWYDESPIWLAAAIASLAGVADHLVAVDGAYGLFPGGRAASPVEQPLAVVEASAAARIPLTLHTPATTWSGNEVEKRNASIELALKVAVDPSWWLLVVDADHRVIDHGDLRRALARTEHDVASYELVTVDDPFANPATERAAITGVWQKRSSVFPRGIYRADPTLRYEAAHYVVRTDTGFLWGHERFHELLPCADVSLDLVFEHRNRHRDYERAEQSRAFYRLRNELNVEQLEGVSA